MKSIAKISILPDGDTYLFPGITDKVIDLVVSRDDTLIVMQLNKRDALSLKKNLDVALQRIWG